MLLMFDDGAIFASPAVSTGRHVGGYIRRDHKTVHERRECVYQFVIAGRARREMIRRSICALSS
jgi:hypothetical protein